MINPNGFKFLIPASIVSFFISGALFIGFEKQSLDKK